MHVAEYLAVVVGMKHLVGTQNGEQLDTRLVTTKFRHALKSPSRAGEWVHHDVTKREKSVLSRKAT